MMKRKKPNQTEVPAAAQEKDDAIRLRFDGEFLELIPTVEYPICVLQTEAYETWIEGISDFKTSTRINSHIDKMQRGLFGDWKSIGDSIYELRLDFGPGYRVYYAKYGSFVVILLGGGDKSDQRQDIAKAKHLWKGLKIEITQV